MVDFMAALGPSESLAWIRNLDGGIVWCNAAAARQLNSTAAEIVGRYAQELWPAAPVDDATRQLQRKPREPISLLEQTPAGRWVQSTLTLRRRRVLWVGVDVTAQVQLAALRSAMQAVRDRSLELGAIDARLPQLLLAGHSITGACAALRIDAGDAARALFSLLGI